MQTNSEKITKEFCQGKILLFYPTTAAETVSIQKKIFAMGCTWGGHGASTDIDCLSECMSKGMVLNDGKLYYNPDDRSQNIGLLCTGDQFGEEERKSAPPLTKMYRPLL
ncbi:MAG: hypothetical protein HY052_01710 [Proteobacteria bacterium]|nr:hypothetical protein [Pseudomonadota bacterium]